MLNIPPPIAMWLLANADHWVTFNPFMISQNITKKEAQG